MDSIDTDGPVLDDQGLNSIVLNILAAQIQDLGADAFARLYPCAFLTLQHGPPRGDDWIDLNTSEASMPRPKDLERRLTDIRTIPLLKSGRNAFGSKVTVGRARNNDVVIRAPKISKLHSAFLLEGKSGYRLQDMGSLNGTVVNGKRLKKKERADLKSGDLISFWRYVFEFLSFDELVRRIQGR